MGKNDYRSYFSAIIHETAGFKRLAIAALLQWLVCKQGCVAFNLCVRSVFMFKRFVHSLLLSPALLSTTVLAALAQVPQTAINAPQSQTPKAMPTIAGTAIANAELPKINQALSARTDEDDRAQSSDLADELADGTTNGVDELDQVTSVSQLTDVIQRTGLFKRCNHWLNGMAVLWAIPTEPIAAIGH
jgi:hypothetical protein